MGKSSYYPLKLGTARLEEKPRVSSRDLAKNQKISKDIKNSVLERDDYTCQCCGFRSEKYQQVHFKDHNKRNHGLDNLLTTCIFCQQCYDLEQVGHMSSGALIWLPELSQRELNMIAKAVYVARISQGPIADAARKIHDLLLSRKEEAERRLTTNDPFILSTILNDYMPLGAYKKREAKLEGIRLLPLDRRIIKETDLEFNQFPQILAYWRSKRGPFGIELPQNWISVYQDLASKAA